MAPRKVAAAGDQTLREHLITTAERLLARRGATPTVREIAQEAGVATGVLYNHFADKEDLLALALHAHVRSVEATLGDPPRPGIDPVETTLTRFVERGLALHEAILPAFTALLAQPEVLVRFRALTNPTAGGRGLRQELADFLAAEQEQGRVAADADLEAAATMIIGACHEVVLPHLYGGTEVVVPKGFAAMVSWTVLHGIAHR
ncbi:DNA-binding transcriptional regulator, AcrR family [Actinokineospora alba]|uniref:DNA-binding transcriptional regulator, AcrR family n=1 Tax=Actinokineospora alba TaxID=504798 RepID=A0A1H0GDD6_9PSEU|nr:TetR/AcrR family transcriptional regulator [Actinokineospora alba]TDP69851.1 TetR family transcriptional regulator [Actinokineospora alba]SDI07304.1 DNA-binding transcriptional regulator, AcrR family [Actinokineospora alba]SDO04892.1 DNA-binding transcriptional regulator, AcrR family [Actinokineospora alba]